VVGKFFCDESYIDDEKEKYKAAIRNPHSSTTICLQMHLVNRQNTIFSHNIISESKARMKNAAF